MSTLFALVLKRKGTTVTYIPAADGSMQPTRDRVASPLTVTYDEDEKRLPVSGRLSYHEAFRMLRQETGQRMAVINASADTATIYGVEEGRAASMSGPTAPLTCLVDVALRSDSRAQDEKPLVVAVFLGPAEKSVPLLVIGLNGDRTMALHDLVPSVADFGTTVTNILGAMVAGNALRGLDFDPRQASRNDEARRLEQDFQRERVVRFALADLVALAQNAQTYPREPVYRGIRRSTVTRGALVTGAVTLTSCIAVAGGVEWLRRSAVGETLALERGMEEQRLSVRTQLLDRLGGLAARVSLDPRGLFAAAEAVAGAGGKVTLVATLESSRLTLLVPHVRERLAPGADRRTAIAARDADLLLAGLRAQAPRGWSQQSIEVSGELNAWLVSFASAPVGRDLLDLVGAGGAPGPISVGGVPAGGSSTARGAGANALGRR